MKNPGAVHTERIFYIKKHWESVTLEWKHTLCVTNVILLYYRAANKKSACAFISLKITQLRILLKIRLHWCSGKLLSLHTLISLVFTAQKSNDECVSCLWFLQGSGSDNDRGITETS